MTAAKISLKKAALSNVYESFRNSVTELYEEIHGWHGWPTAESDARRIKATFKLAQQEMTLRSLENLVTGRKERERKNGKKKDGMRQLACGCAGCGYRMRTSRMWIEVGIPKCPNQTCERFDVAMEEDQFEGIDESTVAESLAGFAAQESPSEHDDFADNFTCIAHGEKGCPICT